MKTLPLILGAILCLACAPNAAAQVKIGVVDINKVFAAYYKTRDAEKKINEARELARKELDERMESHKQMLAEINQLDKDIGNPASNPMAKRDRLAAVSNPNNQIIEEIMRVIMEKVRADKYDLVLDKSVRTANGLPVLLSSPQVSDFSDEVIAVLNRGH